MNMTGSQIPFAEGAYQILGQKWERKLGNHGKQMETFWKRFSKALIIFKL